MTSPRVQLVGTAAINGEIGGLKVQSRWGEAGEICDKCNRAAKESRRLHPAQPTMVPLRSPPGRPLDSRASQGECTAPGRKARLAVLLFERTRRHSSPGEATRAVC